MHTELETFQPVGGRKRGRKETREIRDEIVRLLAADNPMTVRQLFYQLVTLAVIAKTEAAYKSVGRLLGHMRWDGEIPFEWVADYTRFIRKPATFTSAGEMLLEAADSYRRDLWVNQNAYVQIWLEKDALANVLYPVTEEYDVPLLITRGYASLTLLRKAAREIEAQGKPAYLFHFGDKDPSGRDIPEKVEATIRRLAPGCDIHFECVAVTDDQVTAMKLPTRPTKKSDSRAKNYKGDSVEVDAIPAPVLRQIARDCIERHIDQNALRIQLDAEERERAMLKHLARTGLRQAPPPLF